MVTRTAYSNGTEVLQANKGLQINKYSVEFFEKGSDNLLHGFDLVYFRYGQVIFVRTHDNVIRSWSLEHPIRAKLLWWWRQTLSVGPKVCRYLETAF